MDDTLDAVLYDVERAMEFLFDVEVRGSCPDTSVEQLLNDVAAVFNTSAPGAVTGLFVLAENDAFDERDARNIQTEIVKIVQEEVRELLTTIPLVESPGVPTVSEWEEEAFGVRIAAYGAGPFALKAAGWGRLGGAIGAAIGGGFLALPFAIAGAAIALAFAADADEVLLVNGDPATVTLTHLDFWDPVAGRLSQPSHSGGATFNDDVRPVQDRARNPANVWQLTWITTAELSTNE